MKKYLLSLLIIGLSFIGFSSAGSITFIGNGNAYTPSQITFVSDGSFDVSSYSCSSYTCNLDFCYGDDDNFCCGIYYNDGLIEISDCEEIPAGTYNFFDTEEYFDSITLSSSSFEDNTGGGTGGDDNTGGGSGGNNVIGGIINGGTSQLSPVVSAIYSVMLQFIPYVVYIGIGILLCTLGFYAIKWLVNWLTSKITNYFK